MTSFIAADGSGRSASVIPAVPAASSVTTIALIGIASRLSECRARVPAATDAICVSRHVLELRRVEPVEQSSQRIRANVRRGGGQPLAEAPGDVLSLLDVWPVDLAR